MSVSSVLKHINSIASDANRAYDELVYLCPIIADELTGDVQDSAHTYERMCIKAMDALEQSLITLDNVINKLEAERSLMNSKLENRIKRLERLTRK